MRSKNPELMKEICTYVSNCYRDRRSSPSVNEIAKAVGIAKTTAYRYLVDMNERGMISYDGHTIETPQIDKCVSGYFCNITSAPDELVQKAKDWLHAHGMSEQVRLQYQ